VQRVRRQNHLYAKEYLSAANKPRAGNLAQPGGSVITGYIRRREKAKKIKQRACLREYLFEKLEQEWSPQKISERLKLENFWIKRM